MEIAWAQFSWDAFATLTTGGFAVLAAIIVGLRQTRISARQTEILERQMQVGEVALRHELFDRRMEVYEAADRFLMWILTKASYPDRDHETAFRSAIRSARFLFRKEVSENLAEIWAEALVFGELRREMDKSFEKHDHYGDADPKKAEEKLAWLVGRLRDLPDLFGDDLRLSWGGSLNGKVRTAIL